MDIRNLTPAVAADHNLWPAAKGTAPREGGQWGGMLHHGKGEATTRRMPGKEGTEAA